LRGETRPLSQLTDDLSGLTRAERAARWKGSSLPVTSFAGGDLNSGWAPSPPSPPSSPAAKRAARNSKFLNFHKSFSLGNYYREEEAKVGWARKIYRCCAKSLQRSFDPFPLPFVNIDDYDKEKRVQSADGCGEE
jgi:hypothetical protein